MNFQQQHQQQQQHQDEIASGLIWQDVCTSLTQNFQKQSINSTEHLSSQYIDQVVEIEMKHLKANCKREEENYVEQMLLENPIIVERRPASSTLPTKATATVASPAPAPAPAPAPTPPSLIEGNQVIFPDYCYTDVQQVIENVGKGTLLEQQQQQRSDACRRSRINNKIKKAKTKYRHKFMSNKLLQSANVLECLQKLIERTENQLINRGFNAQQLLNLKKKFWPQNKGVIKLCEQHK